MINKAIIIIIVCVSIFWSLNLRDPHLLIIRNFETAIIIGLISIAIVLSKNTYQKNFKLSFRIFAIIIIGFVFITEAVFQYKKHSILNNPTSFHLKINKRLIVGFKDFDEIKKLSLNGIAGIFITKRNIDGKSFEEVQSALAGLQIKRKQAGLPPLIITTDQEGGAVSRLSPLIERQPLLSTLVDVDKASEKSFKYGLKQGRLLKKLGISVNFSPVVDLKPVQMAGLFDFHSLIYKRAISDSPTEVINIALPYIHGLEASGITATLKHFPGLGKVKADTHHFSAQLTTPISELLDNDWLPFKLITNQSNSWIMLSHVILSNIDATNPVSTSKKVVENIIRKKLNYSGVLITDDLTMGATYNQGFCKSVVNSLSADIDFILIAYDHEKYYSLINCLERNDL